MRRGGAALMVIIIVLVVGVVLVITQETGKLSSVPEGQLPEPGLTPRSPFYFIDRLAEDFLLFVYLEPKRKAEVAFRLSKEKLAEAELLETQETAASFTIQEINKKAAGQARELYERYLTIAQENIIKSDEDQERNIDLSFESLDKLLSKELSDTKPLLKKFFGVLPQSIQNKLTEFGVWLQEKQKRASIYYQTQKLKASNFFRDYLKQKASDSIDNLFNREEE